MSANILLAKTNLLAKHNEMECGGKLCPQESEYFLNNNLIYYTCLPLSSKYFKIIVIKDIAQFQL